jgi:hypothetical protein
MAARAGSNAQLLTAAAESLTVDPGQMRLAAVSLLAGATEAISSVTSASATVAGARAREPPRLRFENFLQSWKKGALQMRRLLFILAAAVLGAAILAQSAAAVAPIREDFTFTDATAILTDVCSFPVTVVYAGTGTETDFFDENGNLTRIHIHQVEQDVFTANGKTLVGLPYTFNIQVLFDPESGEVTHVFASGVASRVPLPGGDFFLTAGRVDFNAHPGADFLLQPDVGTQGNIAGFCAALSP